VFDPPSTVDEALEALFHFLQPPAVQILSETAAHDSMLREILAVSRVQGSLMHDAHLVTLALEHGVHEILTLDEDFRRFPQIASRSPFRPA